MESSHSRDWEARPNDRVYSIQGSRMVRSYPLKCKRRQSISRQFAQVDQLSTSISSGSEGNMRGSEEGGASVGRVLEAPCNRMCRFCLHV